MSPTRLWTNLRRFLTTTLAVFLAGVLLLLVGYFSMGLLVGTGDEVTVPNLIGKDSATAYEILLTAGLTPALPIEEDYHDQIPAGQIMGQNPLPGSRVKRGREIRLVKSLGSKKLLVPSMVRMDLTSAENELQRLGLKTGRILSVHHNRIEEGLIVTHTPMADGRMESGGTVDFLLSDGPSPGRVLVPDLRGRPLDQARDLLLEIGMDNIQRQDVEVEGWPPLTVVGQYPEPGSPTAADIEVTLAVSELDSGEGEVRYRFLSYPIPPPVGPGRVEVFFLDEAGFRKRKDVQMPEGGRLEFIERLAGAALVRIYQDRILIWEEMITD